MHENARFYVDLLGRVDVRNRITTVQQCKELIDQMEDRIPHDELPVCYDWLVAKRNHLRKNEVPNHVT